MAEPRPHTTFALAAKLAEVPPMDDRWVGILRGEHPLARAHRLGRRFFALLPSPWRCKFCNAPFKGPCSGVVRWVGYEPSRKNPQICARCIEAAPEGGAIVPLTILFADVRGYTSLSEGLGPVAVTTLVRRLYETASEALLAREGLLGQIAGDEIMGLFVPGLAGKHYPRKAVEAACRFLAAIGYGTAEGSWLDVGVGIASGDGFVGNVGGGGYKDFTALGDVTNTAARLTAIARGGEIVVDERTYQAAADACTGAERTELALKGKELPVATYRIAVAEVA